MTGEDAMTAQAAGRYASALFDLAREAGAADAVEGDLTAFLALLESSEDLDRALASPLFSAGEKTGVLDTLAEKAGFHALTRNAFAVTAHNGRAGELGKIARAYAALAAADRGAQTADVSSARPLSQEQLEALTASLKRALGRDIEVRAQVRPEILGGLIVKVGSRMFDSSLASKLEGVRKAMKEA